MRFRKSLLWAALFAVAIGLGTVPRARSLGSPDFKVFYTAARHVLGEPANMYKISPDRYLYPPSTAILLTPFAFSDYYPLHQWIWHGLLALTLFGLTFTGAPALVAMILLTRYLTITFFYGQITLVVMAILSWSAGWLSRNPRRAGALWAVAVSVKVYPAVFGLAFLPARRRQGLVIALLTGLVIAALPILFFGPTLGFGLYGEFRQALESKGLPLHSHNQSIAALFLRLFTDQEFYLHAVGPTRWAFLSLDPMWMRILALAIGAVLSALSWWKAYRRGEGSQASAFLAAAAFSILFLSHIVWKDYLILLFFPLADFFRRAPRKESYILAGAFAAVVTLSSPDIMGANIATRLDAACIHLWAAILVWMAWWKK